MYMYVQRSFCYIRILKKELQNHFLATTMSMTYNLSMNIEFIVPQVLIETNAYRKAVNDIWDEDEQIEFKNYIGSNPYAGAVIPGTGGIRKIRWQSSGHGKHGGARVIYYIYDENNPLYLLYAYPKNVQINISENEKKVLASVVDEIKHAIRSRRGG